MVGEAPNAELGLGALRSLKPGATLMNLQMAGVGGLNGGPAIRSECASAKIVVLTTYRGDVNARAELEGGAAGLLKSALRSVAGAIPPHLRRRNHSRKQR